MRQTAAALTAFLLAIVSLGSATATPAGFTRVDALTLESGEGALTSAVVDATNGFAYFAAYQFPIVKIRLDPFERVSAITFPPGEEGFHSAVIDTANGYAYFGTSTYPGRIVKVDIDPARTFTRVDAITLEAGDGGPLWSAVIDTAGGFAYFGTLSSPGHIVKVRLNPFERVGAITLQPEEIAVRSAVIDTTHGYAYFGTVNHVVKVRLDPFERVGAIYTGWSPWSAVIDTANGYAYFGTGGAAVPAHVFKFRLDPFELVDSLPLVSGEEGLLSAVIDAANGFAYFGTISYPGRIVKVRLDPLERVDAITLEAGEDALTSAVIDTGKGFAYFGATTNPGRVVKVDVQVPPADTTPPTVEITFPADGAVLVSTTVTFTGTAADNVAVSKVEVSSDGGATWTPASGTTFWSATVNLAEGPHTILARATDTAGNARTASVSVTIDLTPPIVAIATPADGVWVNTSSVSLAGTASDNVAVARVEVSCDDGTTWASAGGTSSWTFLCTAFSPGANRLHARAYDSAGWESAHAVVTVNVDLQPPAVDILTPAPGVTGSNTIEINWIASDLGSAVDHVVVQFGSDAPVVFPPTVSRDTFVGVADGTYPITVTAVDLAGNAASDSVVVVVDTTPPDVSITAPAPGAYLASPDVVLSWTASDATTTIDRYEVSLDGGAPAVLPATTTSYMFLALPDGSHSFGVTAVDGAGNRQTATAVAIVDTTDPTVFLEYPRPEGIVPSSDVRVTWSASDATSGIDRIEVQLLGGSRTVLPGTSREFVLRGLADGGAYQFFVEVFDRTGHTKSASVSFFVDTNLPSVQIETPLGGSVLNSSEVLLRWVAFDSPAGILRFEIRLDEGALVSLGSEQASYTFVGVADGPHTLTVRAFDRAGHDQVVSVSVTIDATPPSLTLASPSAGAVLTSSSVDVRWSSGDATSGLDRIEVALDGGSPETLSAGETRFVLSGLSDGPHTVTVKAYDRAGNVATASASFRVDTAIFSPSGPYGYAPIGGLVVGIVAVAAAAFVIVRQRRKGRQPGHRG